MKELDVLLESFLRQQQQALREGRWPELELLLQLEDDQLWQWLQNPGDPGAAAYQQLLLRIRDVSPGSH